MKKIIAIVMVMVTLFACVGTASASEITGIEDEKEFWTNWFIDQLVVECEKLKEDGELESYAVEYNEESMILVFAIEEAIDEEYDTHDMFIICFRLNVDSIKACRGDIDDFEIDSTDKIYEAKFEINNLFVSDN